ncbi:MAG TPA: hypothetical protein VFR97_09130 [Capillimicrobium sp.]|nr:hypothetical protein [Capillimicrobium sp.]
MAATGAGGIASSAEGYVAGNGAAASDFATGFEFSADRRVGPVGVAFDRSGQLYVSALAHLYRFGPDGGRAADARVSVAPAGRALTGLTFGADGRLYAARLTGQTMGDVVELDPANGAVRRIVAAGIPCPVGLATHPLTGALYVSTVACGDDVRRIEDPGSIVPRTSVVLSGLAVDGLTFAPDGTLYLAHEPDAGGATISALGPNGSRRALASVPNADGVALGVPEPAGSAIPFLVVNRTDGVVTKVDLRDATHPQTDLVVGGSRGDLIAVGADGCLYATQTDRVLKVTNADGSCRLVPSGGGGPGGGSGVGWGDGQGAAPDVPVPALEGGLIPTAVSATSTARGCSPKRAIKVSLRFKGRKLRRASVSVAGRHVRTVKGRALQRPLKLRRLPNRAFTVKVRAKTRGGRSYVRSTRYSACGRTVLKRGKPRPLRRG